MSATTHASPTHASPTRLTAADWVEWGRICKRDNRPDLLAICLNNAAALAAEDGRTIAEMLAKIEVPT